MRRHLTLLSALLLTLVLLAPECRAGSVGWSWSHDPGVRKREIMAVVTVLMIVGFIYGANRILNPPRKRHPNHFLEEGLQPPGVVEGYLQRLEPEQSERTIPDRDDGTLWDRDLDGPGGPGLTIAVSRGPRETLAAILLEFKRELRKIGRGGGPSGPCIA